MLIDILKVLIVLIIILIQGEYLEEQHIKCKFLLRIIRYDEHILIWSRIYRKVTKTYW